MNDLSEFQQRAAAVAVTKLLTGRYFSVSDLDAIAQTIGRKSEMVGPDYAALRALHCVDWADMGPELARLTREKCLELLGLSPQIINVKAAEPAPQPAQQEAAPEKKVRLAFWKQS
jgi:hypothetical protein